MPIVVTGFEPLDLLEGVLRTVRQLEAGRAEVENQYAPVRATGRQPGIATVIEDVFEVCDRKWRGIGLIPPAASGCATSTATTTPSGASRWPTSRRSESPVCISGQVLKGLKKPHDCPAFGKQCTPQTPLGATMVSSEGACAAYYAYGRHQAVRATARRT